MSRPYSRSIRYFIDCILSVVDVVLPLILMNGVDYRLPYHSVVSIRIS